MDWCHHRIRLGGQNPVDQMGSWDRLGQWATVWATDTIKVAPQAFAGATFVKRNDEGWDIAFPDHAAYVIARNDIKRQQMAKAGARLANLLNAIWP